MRQIYLISIFGLYLNIISAQTFTETFETDGEGTRYESNDFTVGCGTDWFRRTQDGACSTNSHNFRDLASNNAINEEGTWYFAGSDVEEGNAGENSLGDGENAYLIMATENVTGFNTFQVVIKLAGMDTNGGTFEGEESIFIEYAFDNDIATGANCDNCLPIESNVNAGNYTNAGAFLSNIPARRYQQDTNLDGMPDGALLTGTFTDYTFTFSTTGTPTRLSIRVQLQHDASAEDAAFDHIRLSSSFVLPVEISEFNARKQEETTVINWITEMETGNKGFEIEHSPNGRNWSRIGFVAGETNSNTRQYYEYIDKNVSDEASYYRLKQLDIDGNYQYSNIAHLEGMEKNRDIYLFPNPVSNDFINLRLSDFKKGTVVQIFNNIGNITLTKTIWDIEEKIDISILPTGIYWLSVEGENHFNGIKFIKM